MFAVIETMLQNKCKSETFAHYKRVSWCFHFKNIFWKWTFQNIFFKSSRMYDNEKKNNYLFNLREGKLLEQFRQYLSNNKKRFLGPQFIL